MKLYKYLLIIIFAGTVSCSDFLKENSQDQAYVKSYSDLDELLIGSCYPKIITDGESLFFGWDLTENLAYLNIISDDVQENILNLTGEEGFEFRASDGSFTEDLFGHFTWQKNTGINVDKNHIGAENADWDYIYERINVANMIIVEADKLKKEGLDNNEVIGNRVRGEAHFLRASYYFILVNLYGKPYNKATSEVDLGVPIKLSETIEDKFFKRNTIEETYNQILSDLLLAEQYLENAPEKSLYRTNITATNLLQSRVYLYMQKWADAKNYAEKVIARKKGLIDLNGFTGTNFISATSMETIFSMYGSVITNVFNEAYNDYGGGEGEYTENYRTFGVSYDLYDQYEDNDLRKVKFVAKSNIEDGVNPFVHYIKNTTQNTNVSDVFLFRTAEAYLNIAEASACMNKESEAKTALETLRVRRMSKDSYEPVNLTGEELVRFIRNERRRELCFEGHRWFDLRRYSVCEVYPESKKITHSYTKYITDEDLQEWVPVETAVYELKPNDAAYTLQIPREVLQFDPVNMLPNVREERNPSKIITY